ncbi:ParA family protein [Novosphingobium sp. B 225]|uniref:ParA family protein n=1 Tax=Novosphingobium sp. B 225 TaxID=1961849 RepID=UPI000B4B1E66|nr:ParA family protein [Novosphingobium sp. B 225]
MAVIAIASVKGGVGKTTLAADLAWRFAAQGGHRTLLWDLDPQAGAGFLLGHDEPAVPRAVGMFQREGRPRQMVEPTVHPGLHLLPADASLRNLPIQLARLGPRRLAQITSLLRSDFDRIVLDCPAGYNELTEQVISAADLVIVPLPPSPLSARSLDQLRRELLRIHHRHPPILPVLSMYNSRRPLHREVAKSSAQGWPTIPYSAQMEQSAVRREPLGAFAPGSEASRYLGRLWSGIEAKIGKRHAA